MTDRRRAERIGSWGTRNGQGVPDVSPGQPSASNATLAAATSPKDTRSEKQVEHAGDLLMTSLGFAAIRFSQPRPTMQTPGWPDRLYACPSRKLAVLWEAKAAFGTQSAHQRAMERTLTGCGFEYVCGTDAALVAWLIAKGIVEQLPNGLRRIA